MGLDGRDYTLIRSFKGHEPSTANEKIQLPSAYQNQYLLCPNLKICDLIQYPSIGNLYAALTRTNKFFSTVT